MTFVSNGQTRIEQIKQTEEALNNSSTNETNLIVDDNSNNDYEKILDYKVDILVKTNSSLEVTETIKVNSKGKKIKRGIFRTLPTRRNLNGESYEVKYNIISIKRDGVKDGFHKETSPEYLKIYIGDKDVILDSGIYTYEIKYEVNKQIGFFDSYDELYWNVTGTDWDFDIAEVEVTVHLPNGADIIQNACYTGVYGSNAKNCNSEQIDATTMVWETKNLNPKEDLTIAVGFKKGIVFSPPPPSFLEIYGITISLIIAFICLSYYCYNLWKKYGIDPEKPTVYPQFSPPNNLSPAAISYLYYEKISERSITATLTNLAINKALRIEETEGINLHNNKIKYKLKKIKLNNKIKLGEEEFKLMSALFNNNSEVCIDGRPLKNIYIANKNFEDSLKKRYSHYFNIQNNRIRLIKPFILFIYTFLIGIIIETIVERNILFLKTYAIQLIILTILIIVFNLKLSKEKESNKKKKNRKKDTIPFGLIKIFLGLLISIFLFTSIITSLVHLFLHSEEVLNFRSFYYLGIGLIGSVIMYFLIKKPLSEKIQIQSDIEGFRMYLSAAEYKQIQFHNPPEITPEIFEKNLPYAMVFGVEKIWGRKFNQIFHESKLMYNPTWYVGEKHDAFTIYENLNASVSESISISIDNFKFSKTLELDNEIKNSNTNSNINSNINSKNESYSGGSSSSGSSGGGSSGGGGGGGGGGGW